MRRCIAHQHVVETEDDDGWRELRVLEVPCGLWCREYRAEHPRVENLRFDTE